MRRQKPKPKPSPVVPREPAPREESMTGLAKGLAVIEIFSVEHPATTVTEAAALTAQAPAAARRSLRTLEQLGYLSYDGKFYRPTPRFVRLAAAYTDADPLPRLAQPLLDELRDRLDESASLAVLDRDEVLFVARAESRHIVSTGMRVGGRLPAASSAVGRVLLGERDEHGELRETLALNDEDIEIGLRAVAVPVVGPAGRVVAAMSMSALSARVGVDRLLTEFVPELQRAAVTLGRKL